MGDADRNTYSICKLLQILFKYIVVGVVTAPTITKKQKGPGVRIMTSAVSLPPACYVITGKHYAADGSFTSQINNV